MTKPVEAGKQLDIESLLKKSMEAVANMSPEQYEALVEVAKQNFVAALPEFGVYLGHEDE